MSFPSYSHLATKVVRKSAAKYTMAMILIAIFLATPACTSTTDKATPPGTIIPSQENRPTATYVGNLKYFFPQQEPVEGPRVVMAAGIPGTLVLVDECIRLNVSDSSTSYLPIWPPEFSLNTEHDPIQILDGGGKVVANVGDMVLMAGGAAYTISFLPEFLQKNLPPSCIPPYWIVGDEVIVLETSK